MGIKGFNRFISDSTAWEAITTIQMNLFRNTRIAIDGNLLMYTMMSGANMSMYNKLDLKSDPNAIPDTMELTKVWMKLILDRLVNICIYGITPVVVFDGNHKPEKAVVQQKRKDMKIKTRDEANVIKDRLISQLPHERSDEDVKSLRTKKQNVVYVTQEQTNLLKNVLRVVGIPNLTAMGDGEELCCTLAHFGKVSAVYSKDADCAIFGTPISITGLTAGSRPPNQTFDVILYDKIVEGLGITREILIDACILHGCDYSPGVKGYGLIKSIKALKTYGRIENIPGLVIPEDLELEMARDSFRIKSLNECLGEVHEGKLPSLGINRKALTHFGTRPFLESYDLGRYINLFMSAYENINVDSDRGAEYILPSKQRTLPGVNGDIIIKRPEQVEDPKVEKTSYESVVPDDPISIMMTFN